MSMTDLDQLLQSAQDNGLKYRLSQRDGLLRIRFEMATVLTKQPLIVLLWIKLNRHHFRPVAKTFLGKISAIHIRLSDGK